MNCSDGILRNIDHGSQRHLLRCLKFGGDLLANDNSDRIDLKRLFIKLFLGYRFVVVKLKSVD